MRFYIHPKPYKYKILELSATTYKIVRISSAEKDAYKASRIDSSKQSSVYTTENNEKSDISIKDSSSVFATNNSNIYHKSNCPELSTDDLIEFKSPQEADDSGGIPCKHCNPLAIAESTKQQNKTLKSRTKYKWTGWESLFKSKNER